MHKIFSLSLLIFSLSKLAVLAQDVQYSQIFADRLYLNPAFAGSDYCPKFTISYRNQWPGIDYSFTTYNASFDKYSETIHGGFGFRVMKDDQGQGTFNQLSFDAIYSYHVKINKKSTLKFAFEVSAFQQNMNTRDLIFYNMIDPAAGVIYPNTESIAEESFF